MWVVGCGLVRKTEEEEEAEEEQTQALERGRAPGNKKDERAQKGTSHRGEGRRW